MESASRQRGMKRQLVEISKGGDEVYRFKILLPNGTSIGLNVRDPGPEMPFDDFINLVKEEYFRVLRHSGSMKQKRSVNWKVGSLVFQDANDVKLERSIFNFRSFKPHKCYILRLHDGSGESSEIFENMWDLTPDTELLRELPEEYTFETALADLIDNSLQAVWSNHKNDRRLVRLDVSEDRISIFDTGPGMDGSDENSIVKWGKMGASLHRASKAQAIGGKPPYLKPFFGMFGYGGPIASMHLGRYARVSSKTKKSTKVYILHLEREALLSNSGSEHTWKTGGGIRKPLQEEIVETRQGSFTKVEIFEPKTKSLDIPQLRCWLKDIYFPYIQCDEMSNTGKTITPVEFEVNGINLAEIEGGEVATTNLHSCNGPDFVLQLHFSLKQASVTKSPGSRLYREANARLKFVYFPVVEGKESMEKILEKLKADGHEITDIYNTFSRVSVRRLGRLLPDARWASLPFMDLRHKKGSKAQILKTCCARVKCFIDIDAGINPTPSKTDLAHQNPFAIALRNFGNNTNENEKGIDIEVYRDGKLLSSSQVEKDYQDWILQMHMQYDEEVDHGEDQPVLIVSPAKGKEVGISSDVMRVHKVLKRKGVTWKSGQKIKILKGACAGVHKNNVYATLEYFLLGGFEGDAGGKYPREARIICRPLGTSDENGCILSEHNGKTSLDKRSSLSIPVSVIDAEKCIPLEATEWNQLLEKHRQKCPSTIDLLSTKEYQELEIGGEELPAIVTAGKASPKEIVAVVRPANYGPQSDHLQQKYISKCKTEMLLEVKFNGANKDVGNGDHLCSWRVTPSSHKGIHGLYVFSLGRKFSNLFQKVGFYTFSFSLTDSSCKNFVKKVNVKASSEIRKWKVLSNNRSLPYSFRVGSFSGPPIVVACYDIYDNQTRFTSTPQVQVKIQAKEGILFHVKDFKPRVSYSGMELRVKDLLIQSSELDKIRPGYGATLVISSSDKLFSASVPCHVNPGCIEVVKTRPSILANQLIPGCIIKELKLEMFDGHGNHVMEGSEVQLNLEGFEILDQLGLNRKVDDCGGINLNGILKVTAGYGANVSFSVSSDNKVLIKQEFKIERRELRLVSKVPDVLMAGSILGNMVFEIVNSEGDVDETIHDEDKIGQSNLLTIKSDLDGMMESVRYTFKHGRCTVPVIPVPQREGSFCFSACHSRHSNLKLLVKVPLVKPAMPMVTPKLEYGKIQSTPSDGKILLLQDSSSPTQVENKIIMSIENKKKRLEHDLLCMGVSIGTLERTLGLLKEEKEKLEQMVKELQESTSVCLVDFQNCFCTKVELTEEIEKMGNSAAAALCKISRRVPFQEQQNDFMKDIIGVVALLGRVNSSQLSRILSEYLGLDQMLAVVTRSFEAANVLQKYKQNEGDCSDARLAEGVALLKSMKDRFTVFCLEDISPYVAAPECGGSQRNLPLPVPFIPDGTVPTGFLGFAVNMIDLDVDQLQIKTTSGHGLRETLFYGLFGQLQVYRTRDEMLAARACIKHGAVSLDGGILKENSGVTFGTRNPGICFQVVARETESVSGENVKLLAEKKSQLRELEQRIVVEMKTREKTIKKFKRMKSKYLKLADEMNPLLEDFYSEHGIQPTLTQETAGARRRD